MSNEYLKLNLHHNERDRKNLEFTIEYSLKKQLLNGKNCGWGSAR